MSFYISNLPRSINSGLSHDPSDCRSLPPTTQTESIRNARYWSDWWTVSWLINPIYALVDQYFLHLWQSIDKVTTKYRSRSSRLQYFMHSISYLISFEGNYGHPYSSGQVCYFKVIFCFRCFSRWYWLLRGNVLKLGGWFMGDINIYPDSLL